MSENKDVKKDLVKEWLDAEKYNNQSFIAKTDDKKFCDLQHLHSASNFFLIHSINGNTVCRNCATIMHKSLLVNHLCRQCNADNLANTEE
jgi:hypothetical protein